MITPPLNELLDKVDCRYTLVVEVSKRARQIVDGAATLVDVDASKPVLVAVTEVNDGLITYERAEDGIK